jgi:hypothetical protein
MKKTMLLALLVMVIIVGMTMPAYADRKAVSVNIGKWTPDGYVNINIHHNDCDRRWYPRTRYGPPICAPVNPPIYAPAPPYNPPLPYNPPPMRIIIAPTPPYSPPYCR